LPYLPFGYASENFVEIFERNSVAFIYEGHVQKVINPSNAMLSAFEHQLFMQLVDFCFSERIPVY
jgi:hypothetical protein